MRVLVERRARVGHVDLVEKLDRPLLRLRGGEVEVGAQRLDDLETDRVDGVQGRHGLLEDHGDLAAAHLAQLVGTEPGELPPEELDRAGDPSRRRQQAEERHRARALARAGLTDDREHLAAAHPIGEPDRSGVVLAVHPEVDTEVGDLENGLDSSRSCGGHE